MTNHFPIVIVSFPIKMLSAIVEASFHADVSLHPLVFTKTFSSLVLEHANFPRIRSASAAKSNPVAASIKLTFVHSRSTFFRVRLFSCLQTLVVELQFIFAFQPTFFVAAKSEAAFATVTDRTPATFSASAAPFLAATRAFSDHLSFE